MKNKTPGRFTYNLYMLKQSSWFELMVHRLKLIMQRLGLRPKTPYFLWDGRCHVTSEEDYRDLFKINND